MDPKVKTYGEFLAGIMSLSFGAELMLLTFLYFVRNSINPFQAVNHASIQSVVIFTAILAVGIFIVFLTIRAMKNNAGRLGSPGWETEFFVAFIKDSRLWLIVPFLLVVMWLVINRTIETASNLPAGSSFMAVFNFMMVFFMGFGGIMVLFGLGIVIRNFRMI
jgi:hypothetical protein